MKKQLLLSIFMLFFFSITAISQTLSCGELFTDAGGTSADYSNNSDYIITIHPNNPGEVVTVTFTSFNIEANYDGLYVYNGNSTASPQIASSNPAASIPGGLAGAFWGTTNPGSFTSSHSSGSLTFRFVSDNIVTKPGWTANVSCGLPSTCFNPTNISTTGVTSNSVTVGWLETGAATTWEVIILPCGTVPTPSSVGVITTANPYVATGLSLSTCYTVSVRAICSSSETSNWSTPLAFTTSFAPPVCGGTFVDNGGPSGNYTSNSDNTYTICPEVPGDVVSVVFTSFNIESNWDGLYVYNGNSTASPQIASANPAGNVPGGLAGAYWGTTIPEFFTSSSPDGCLTFRFRSDTSNNLSGWIANVVCGTLTGCFKPTTLASTSLTPNSVTVGWTETGAATQWEVIALPSSALAPTATSVGTLTNSNPYTFTDLTPNTTYKFYVRAVCSATEVSLWSNSLSATTSFVTTPPLVTNTTLYTNEQLVTNVLVNNPCITISNVTSSTGTNFGSTNGIGYFTNTNPNFPLSSGIVLSTGNVNNVPGPNTSILSDGGTSWTGDAQLESIITAATGTPMNSKNATKLEFDFTSLNEFMSFNFLFASDEYGNFQCTFADAFAFLLTDLVTGVTTNLAVVPGTSAPISVVTIRDVEFNTGCASVNPDFFDTYYQGANVYNSATNFNGHTTEMSASSAILPNHPYHIKLVVADRGDSLFDSAVFIKAGSFTSGPPECSDKIQLVSFIDTNANGIKDSGEVNFTYGSFVYQINDIGDINNITSPFGSYTIYDSNVANSYDFSYTINSEYATYYSAGTTTYNNISIALGSGTQTFYFPIVQTNPFNDVSVSIVPVSPPRPGFSYTNKVVYQNLGVATTSGTITYTKDPQVTIASISQGGTVSTATGFNYDFTNLVPYETRTFNVTMNVPSIPVVNLDDILTNSASISSPSGDINLVNNAYSNSQIVVASYDPNDKMESHGDKIQFDQFESDDYLYYTIRFQNEGTANAITVRIEDLLDTQLDETSIRVVSASHPYIMERVNNQITWNFNFINLPPALANEELSKGYIFFKVKLKPGFAVGDIIPNTAEIYFDTNPAIVTNTFNTEFIAALNTLAFASGNFVLVPNPASTYVQVNLQNNSDNIKDILIYDVLGKVVKKVESVNANQTNLTTSDLSSGVYMVEITTENDLKQVKKLVIK